MNQNKLVSIIVPCYNDWQYVEQAVNSALNQTYPHKEVIVVDDGSDAKTKAVLKKIEHKITKLITQENQGQSTARNVGIDSAKGEYILVLDSDDFFEPTFCVKAIQVIAENPEVKIVSCYSILFYEDGSSCIFETLGGRLESFLFKNYALGSALFKKDDWSSCGGYDEMMKLGYEDWEFYIRLLKGGGIAEIIKESLYTYRQRNGTTTDKAQSNKYELYRYIFVKHSDLYKKNFEHFIDFLLYKINREEKEKIKNTQRLEFRIGKAILKPLRWFKSLF